MSLFDDFAAIDVLYKMDILDMMADFFEEKQSTLHENMDEESCQNPKEE